MKRTVLVAISSLGVFASGAFAADVSIKGRIDETFEASDNYFLSNAPRGYTARSLSAGNLNFLAATPVTRYRLDTNYSYYKYFGPGAQDTTLTWGTPADARFSIEHNPDKLTKYDFGVSWQRSDVATTALQQIGRAIGRGTIDTYKADAAVTREISRLDTVSLSGSATTVSYTDPAQTPYTDYTTRVGWNHRLTPTTTVINAVSMDWFIAENTAHTQRLFWNPTTGLQSQLSNRLTLNATIGWAFVNAYQEGTATTPAVADPFGILTGIPTVGTFQPQIGASNGWTGNMSLVYRLMNNTQVTFNAAHSISPTIFGQLQKIDSVGASFSYTINQSESVSLLTQFSKTQSSQNGAIAGTTSDFFTASANYSYLWARDLRSNVSYTYRQRTDDTGTAKSSTILVKLSRDFSVLGKPPPEVRKTPLEVAQDIKMRSEEALPTLVPF